MAEDFIGDAVPRFCSTRRSLYFACRLLFRRCRPANDVPFLVDVLSNLEEESLLPFCGSETRLGALTKSAEGLQ